MSEAATLTSVGKAAPSRFRLLAALALIELPFLAFVYDPFLINNSDPLWVAVQSALRGALPAAVFAIAALGILLAPSRSSISADWREAKQSRSGSKALVVNLVAFALLAAATKGFNIIGARIDGAPWALFMIWTAGVFALYAALALAAAPAKFWRALSGRYRWHGAVALGAGALVQSAALLSQQSWNALSRATFEVSAAILRLVEPDVTMDADARILGVADFKVNIAAACSGYEGIGLVTVFMAIYLWMFRRELRYPNAWLILPIGVAAIWLMNAVRIAALILIGAHVSSDVAITGFHSQAGWMTFLFVTIGVMAATHSIGFFRKEPNAARESGEGYGAAVALLAPFMAMTAASVVAAAFSAGGYWLYGLRVLAAGAALLAVARCWRRLDWRCGAEPLLLGLLVGAAWIATDPERSDPSPLGDWLSSLSAPLAIVWIIIRVIGTTLIAPIAEELAFRGYLHRKLIADRFETVAEGAFTWKALVVTSLLFGAIHGRWLSGALAGAVFAIAMARSGKLSGAVVAHVAANALIALWAIAFGQWSLF